MIPRVKSTGEKLMQGLGLAAQAIPDMIGEYRKEKSLQEERDRARTEKLLGKSTKDVPAYLKTYQPDIYGDPEALQKITDFYRSILLENPGIDPYNAQNLAIQQYQNLLALPQAGEEGKQKHFWQMTPEERAAIEYPYHAASYAAKHPGKAAASAGLSVFEPAEMLSTLATPSQWGAAYKAGTLSPISDMLREKAGFGELSEEGKEAAGTFELGTSAIPWGGVFKNILRPFKALSSAIKSGKAVQEAATLGKEAGIAAKETGALERVIGEPAEATLAGRVSTESPKTGTELRMERAKPSHKLYKEKAQEELRKTQLKKHPKYAEEIASDAADRAMRAEKVLGPRAQTSKALRMQVASQEVPKANADYQKSIARVRALENQLASSPQMASEIQPVLDVAINELRDAEFLLKQTMNNALTGESRVGLEAMRGAAQNKVLNFGNEILEGKEIKLALKDYNPEMIKKAKALPKKPLEARKTEDFFTQVHGEYQKIYQDRIEKIDQELAALSKEKGMWKVEKQAQLHKEKDILKKLSDHVDAENAIHRHKLALREMHQRKVAQDRFGKLTKAEGKPKVAEAAKPAIEKRAQIAERLKTSEGRAQIADDAIEEVAAKAKTPKEAEQVRAQKETLKDAIEKVHAKGEKIKEKVASGADTKTLPQKRKSILNDLSDFIDSFKKGPTAFYQTRLGKDLLLGTAVPVISEILKENGIDIPANPLISAVLGGGGLRGSGYRALFSVITKKLIETYKKSVYREARKTHDRTKVASLKKKYPRKLTKAVEEESYSQ